MQKNNNMVMAIRNVKKIEIALVCPLGKDEHQCSKFDLYSLLGISVKQVVEESNLLKKVVKTGFECL